MENKVRPCSHGPSKCKRVICEKRIVKLKQYLDMIRIHACENNWTSIEKLATQALEEK